jgi:hypothetical protein
MQISHSVILVHHCSSSDNVICIGINFLTLAGSSLFRFPLIHGLKMHGTAIGMTDNTGLTDRHKIRYVQEEIRSQKSFLSLEFGYSRIWR